ncbi:hypothetical protein HKB21_15545 [Vibrio parahaemolyticus]|uniref:Uncharacterized protein n=1 Tax=Vibrio parahaemolyticus TaxID=670 RepID=A0A7Y0X6K6_VIBPH|nr:hypothetical protein [Vibrio parahaemolyticus]
MATTALKIVYQGEYSLGCIEAVTESSAGENRIDGKSVFFSRLMTLR